MIKCYTNQRFTCLLACFYQVFIKMEVNLIYVSNGTEKQHWLINDKNIGLYSTVWLIPCCTQFTVFVSLHSAT